MDQSLFPAPHGLSQGITSFIASCCQGIHQTPFSRLIRSRKSIAASSGPEAYYTVPRWFAWHLVSVLDLTVSPSPGVPRGAPTLGCTGDTDVLLFTMSCRSRPVGRSSASGMRSMIEPLCVVSGASCEPGDARSCCATAFAHSPDRPAIWWSLSGSNR
jgi:hypothetical protein